MFLPRAFSLHGQAPDEVSFLISPIGPGTEELVGLSAGDVVWVLGPLGRGFPREDMVAREGRPAGDRRRRSGSRAVPAADRSPWPLPKGFPAATVVLLGFRDATQAECVDVFDRAGRRAPCPRRRCAAGDHPRGWESRRRGLVTRLLAEELRAGDVVVACGAHAMCDAVWQLCAKRDCSAWFSLEAGMACGVGSCQGCVIPMADGSLARVCREGPVFAGQTAFGEGAHPCASPGGEA